MADVIAQVMEEKMKKKTGIVIKNNIYIIKQINVLN